MTQQTSLAVVVGVSTLVLGPVGQWASGMTYRFAYRAPQVGDFAAQDIHCEMNLILSIQQSQQTVHSTDRGVGRRQHRTVTVLGVEEGRVTRVKVAFATSEQSISDGAKQATLVRHPVAGKAYFVARDRNRELRITDLEGNRPPPEETTIVAQAMEAMGQRNPLAMFFDQRTIAVGQTVALPKDLANDLIGFREAIGAVSRFDMTLVAGEVIAGKTCARFDTRIDADSPLGNGQTLRMRGQFVLEVDTCRTTAIQLSCPVAVTETRGPEGGKFTVVGQGSLQVSMRSRHGQTVASTSR